GLALGTIRLPFMLLAGMPAAAAGGTNILVSTLSSGTGSIGHLRAQRVEWRAVLVQGGPAIFGGVVGGFSANVAPENLLIGLAGGFVLWQSVELVQRAKRIGATPAARGAGTAGQPGPTFTRTRMALEGLVGLTIGFVGGAVGLILGTLRLPMLIQILRLDPRVAAGTNLVVGTFLGVAGWVGHATTGSVDYPMLAVMGSLAMVGTVIGTRLTGSLSLRALLRLMAVVLGIVGLLLLARAFGITD
ncbi:MAG: sulfite exporter TauE/SafE family protein, partial [Dehalococcoidia bacterium]|nr:sulfite exporter TauE/SafE family protein [Dehalococcoidia bacterium]